MVWIITPMSVCEKSNINSFKSPETATSARSTASSYPTREPPRSVDHAVRRSLGAHDIEVGERAPRSCSPPHVYEGERYAITVVAAQEFDVLEILVETDLDGTQRERAGY